MNFLKNEMIFPVLAMIIKIVLKLFGGVLSIFCPLFSKPVSSSSNHGISHVYAACHINELSRWSVLGYTLLTTFDFGLP